MSGLAILVVYQDETYFGRIRAALEPVGYDVRGVTSPLAAVSELQRERPKVIVLSPCLAPATIETIATTAQQIHPGLTILRLSPNHVDRISELLQ